MPQHAVEFDRSIFEHEIIHGTVLEVRLGNARSEQFFFFGAVVFANFPLFQSGNVHSFAGKEKSASDSDPIKKEKRANGDS